MTMMTAMRINALAKAKPAFAADEPADSSLNGVYSLKWEDRKGHEYRSKHDRPSEVCG